MKSTVIKIALDVTKLGSQVEIPMFRGDTKRTLVFSLTENGKPYNLEDCFVAFTGEKADGNFLNNICDVDIEKQVAIYDLDKDDNHRQTTTCEGPVKCQLVIYKNDSRVASACFNLLVMKTIYNEEEILDSETALGFYAKSTDLLDYVLKTRAIAGIDLQDDITAEELQTALNTYPVLTSSSLSEIKANTKVGQLALYTGYNGSEYIRDIYYGHINAVTLIGGTTFNNNMFPKAIKKYLDENPVVPTTRTIADIELSEDITTKELRDALGVEDMELYSYATRIQSAQTPNTLTLSLMADTHYCDKDGNADKKLETAKTVGLISHYADLDAIVNLGDMVSGKETKSETITDLTTLINSTRENAKCPVYFVRGNHDDNGWYSYEGIGTNQPNEIINNDEWCNLVGNTFVTDDNNSNGGYGYFEHEKSKIRVFVLNSSDIPYVLNTDGSYRYNGYQCYAFSNAQLNFVANALKFEDKENPSEWAAMFLMHAPLDTTIADGYRFGCPHALVRGSQQMLSIITAYKNGTSYNFSGSVNDSTLDELAEDFAVDISVDYSTKGVGDVICFVNGHTHTDNASQKVGYENSLSYGYTYLGIIGAVAFATMVIDRENNIVTTFKYGEVRSQTDSELINHNVGAVNGETEFDIDMSTGTWIIPFVQFRPTAKNLYNGLSDLWGDGYYFDSSAHLNAETLELINAAENEKYCLTKAINVKQSTSYIIPQNTGISVNFYRIITGQTTGGTANTNMSVTDGDNCKIITTSAFNGTGYLVFAFNRNTYTDYENFYIKEVVASEPTEEVEYIKSPTTAEVGQAIVVKSVDSNGKPTEWEAIDTVSPERIDDLESWVGDLEGAFGNGVPYVDTAQVGQVISVAQINEDGMPIVWEAVDLPSGDESGNSIEIDTTLTVAGAAADAKAVGDKLDFLRKYNGWIDTNTGVYIDTTTKTLTFGANSYVTYGNQLFNVSNTTHDISTMIGGAWVYLDISSSPYKLTKDRNTSYVILLGALWKPNHLADFHMDKTKLFVDGMPVSYTGRYHNKTINCLGDSMTEGVGTTKAYHQWFGQLCGFKTINNYGLGGSCLAPIGNNDPAWTGEENIQSFYERYSSMSSADVITVFGGVNDWSTGRELGTIEDTTSNTFYGAMKLLCEGLIAKYPTSDIFVFSSPQCDYINRPANKLSGTQWAGNTEGYNRKGYKLQDYANAMGEVCAIYGITFTNLTNNLFYGLSGVLGDHNGNSGAYGSDALHPNAEGHKKIALKMASVINSGVGSV